MDTSKFELTDEEMSEVIQRDTHKWSVCNPEFVMDVASVIAKAQISKVLSLLEPVGLEALGCDEVENIIRDYGLRPWKGDLFDIVSQATVHHNQSKGQLYRIKDAINGRE